MIRFEGKTVKLTISQSRWINKDYVTGTHPGNTDLGVQTRTHSGVKEVRANANAPRSPEKMEAENGVYVGQK